MRIAASGEVKDWRWRLDLQHFQALSRLRGRFGDLPDGAVRAGQLRELDAPQAVRDIAPCVSAGVLDGAFEKQRQHGDGHMLSVFT